MIGRPMTELPDWSTEEWATIVAAAFTALAALSAAIATLLQLRVLRSSRRPHLSHANFEIGRTRGGEHEIVGYQLSITNAGPGVAVQVGFLGVYAGDKFGGAVGSGHLQPFESAAVNYSLRQRPGTDVIPLVYACRDIDMNAHIWSNDGRYTRIGRRRVLQRERTKLGDFFHELYPSIEIPP
jgi:hypothetical protein